MELPSLPTDSVYKFQALAGLVIIALAVLSFAFVFDHLTRLMHEGAHEASKLLDRSLALSAKLADADKPKDVEIAAMRAEIKHISDSIELVRARTESFGRLIKFAFWGCTLLVAFGLCWHSWGMLRWHQKLQKHQDRLLELQVKAQEKALSTK